MTILSLTVLTLATLAAAAYAQYRMPFHIDGRTSLWLTRALFLAVGVGLGWAMARYYHVAGVGPVAALLIFLSGFGVVHVPAAFILF